MQKRKYIIDKKLAKVCNNEKSIIIIKKQKNKENFVFFVNSNNEGSTILLYLVKIKFINF